MIGTGASAIQIVPELQKTLAATGGHLDVYQRTAPWVIPRNDRPYGRLERAALRRVPGLQQALPHRPLLGPRGLRAGVHAPAQARRAGRARWPSSNIKKGIKDPELRAKVTPHFDFGCKRVLRSNTYYPALAADNTELVTDPIAKVTGNAIVTADGVEREIDVLVVATGFYTTELPITEHVTGRTGRTLADRWRETGMAAYKGTTVPDFPNLFLLVGPNTGQGHTSMIFIIESQVAYVRDAIAHACASRGSPASSRPRRDTDSWNRSLQKRMGRTVWTTGGCQSWYLDAHGRNTTLWPRSTVDFRRRLASFDADAYQDAPTRRRSPHEDARRQGGRDHRRRLRHRPRPRPQPGPPRLAARALRRGRGRAGRDRRAGRSRPARAEVRSDRLDVADRDAFGALRARRRPGVRPGQRRRSTTPASRWPATSPTSSTTTSTGSSA